MTTKFKKRKTEEGPTIIEDDKEDKASVQRTSKIDQWWIEDYPEHGEAMPGPYPSGIEQTIPEYTYKPEELKFSGFSSMYKHAFGGQLLPWHEVKASNGILMYRSELKSEKNRNLQTYYYSGWAEPTRGNCPICGASGPLGRFCANGCKDPWESREKIEDAWEAGDFDKISYCGEDFGGTQWYNLPQEEDPLGISKWACESNRSRYWIIMTPDQRAIIDAELWAEVFYDMPAYRAIIMEYLGEDPPTRRAIVPSNLVKWDEENWTFDGPHGGQWEWSGADRLVVPENSNQ